MHGFAAVLVTVTVSAQFAASHTVMRTSVPETVPKSRVTAVSDSTHAQREQAAEYSVYSYLLRRGQKGIIIVNDSTTPAFQGRAVFCFEPDREPGSCLEPQSGTSVETWKNFARKNRRPQLIQPLFDKDLGVILKRDATLPEPTCQGPTITYFSSVGLSPDLTEAVVHVTTVTGKGPMPPCGFATGEHLVLRRTPAGWEPFGPASLWIT